MPIVTPNGFVNIILAKACTFCASHNGFLGNSPLQRGLVRLHRFLFRLHSFIFPGGQAPFLSVGTETNDYGL